MIRGILLLVISFGLGNLVNAQDIPYWFKVSSAAYLNLEESNVLTQSDSWNEKSTFPLQFNFPFQVDGQAYTTVQIKAGGMEFTGYDTKKLYVFHRSDQGYLLKSGGEGSGIFYQIDGVPGERILKVEWRRAQLIQKDTLSQDILHIDYQIWLFEVDQHIEVHFGRKDYGIPALGYLENSFNYNPDPKFICRQTFGVNIFGAADNPAYSWEDYSFPTQGALSGIPTEGTVYSIQPNPNSETGFNQEISEDIDLYPNPVQSDLHIVGHRGGFLAEKLEITNMQGQVIYSEDLLKTMKSLPITINLTGASPGVYLVKLRNSSGNVLNRKIVVIPN